MSSTGNYWNTAIAATKVLKNGSGILRRIIINTPVLSGTVTVYDNNAASGNKIVTITLPATLLSQGPAAAEYDLAFNEGLTVVVTGAMNVTVVYS